jgi:hypothetical protein
MPRSNAVLLALLQLNSAAALNLRHTSADDVAHCWEYLWTGHANASAVGEGALKDLGNFADSAAAYKGPGHFGFYVDSSHGTDAGHVLRSVNSGDGFANLMATARADQGAADASFAHSLNSKLITTQHFDSLEQVGLAAPMQAALEQMTPKDTSCTRIVSYSGHGYNFNGIGYQDHKFMPWQSFTEPLYDAFGGPVDLLALDTCRMATYMMLEEVQSSAYYVLTHQHEGVFLNGYGSWSFESLPFASASDAKSFGSQLLKDSMSKNKAFASKGMSLVDMNEFAAFSKSFGELLTFVTGDAMDEMMPYLLQGRKQSFEFRGPSLYEPDSSGMLVDADSFLRSFQNALPSQGSSTPSTDKARGMIDTAIAAKQRAVVLTDHDDIEELAGETGMSLWFMKPEATGMHKELLNHIRQRLTRTSGGIWADFLAAYYTKAEHMKLAEDDMHQARAQSGPIP